MTDEDGKGKIKIDSAEIVDEETIKEDMFVDEGEAALTSDKIERDTTALIDGNLVQPGDTARLEDVAAAVRLAIERMEANKCGKKDCERCQEIDLCVWRVKQAFPAVADTDKED